MCGIFAHLIYRKPRKAREVVRILIQGLHRLEYRGYDSAGICIDHTTVGLPAWIAKRKGHVEVLEKAIEDSNEVDLEQVFETHIGIAHTRWATHGVPCDVNAHPITSDESNEFVIVHNGIVTNYAPLKQVLQLKGFTFHSETDTEVISKLMKYLYDEQLTTPRGKEGQIDFGQLVMEVMDQLEGAFALVVKSSHYPDQVVCCKRGSPLIVGFVKDDHDDDAPSPETPKEYFFASDASALVEHTRQVIYLEDDDVVHFKKGNMNIFNRLHNRKHKEIVQAARVVHTLEMEVENIMKGNYDHFMQKEIFEQPESIVNTMRGRIDFDNKKVILGGFKEGRDEILRKSRRLIFIACGTSYYSAMSCRNILEELAELPVVIELASDFLDRRPPIFRDDVCCFVSQSGETADTLRALEYCKEKNSFTVGFTNTVGSAIARLTDCGVHINAGCEIGVASTKAYTSQCACIILLALLLSEDRRSKQGRREEIFDGLKKMPELMKQALELNDVMRGIAERLQHEKSILLMGRWYQYAICLEGALKIKELAYIHSEGILAGELKHGPLALIDENMPVIMLASKDEKYPKVKSSLQQILARKGRPFIFLTERDPEMEKQASEVIMLPKTVDCLQPLVHVIPLQLLAYHLAVFRGLNVDCPRNLAKSVTTE
eukprot:Sspe_Gene.34999::Locus_16985_Transcript_1_1_Confidence_1.000_Length_2434::g.34999::m.34999/K00820/glmS, GFPT; glucosamine--fructose-6-phosphate aminotransferase (isomerizing)